ncbi:ATP-grasp domain-containing protein [Priestia endophytica]|uniref:ATP-grasp domain-containing protein n=1 Tax=Priestia endophytica TaxID=135735 RepID=UPI0022812822|nr:ATP-grasp domain-containing protein [Priestia endophytica]MCY8234412.1 ATP-grasp domain-containing protein [Priestia endophytica]
MNNPFIILVSPRDNEVKLVQELGYRTILLRKEIAFDEVFEVDIPVEIDLNNETLVLEKCLELANNHDIASVFTMNEYRIPLTSKISEVLQLDYMLPYEAANACRNKKLARKRLNEAGVGPVQYHLVTSQDDVASKVQDSDFPLIVKPSNDSGSKNVYLCKNLQEVSTAVQNILQGAENIVGQTIDSEVLIEEFLEGPEFSVESVTVHGRTTIIGITRKVVTPYPLSIEVGHDFPAQLSPHQEKDIEKLVIESLKVIGVDFCVTHTEVKLTEKGPKIVEINARPGGDEIPELVKAVNGIDLKTLAFYVTLGKGIDDLLLSSSSASSASIRFLLANKAGKALFDENFHSPYIKKKKWYIQKGDVVPKTESNFNRLGYFIVYGNTETSSFETANSLQKSLDVTIQQPLET